MGTHHRSDHAGCEQGGQLAWPGLPLSCWEILSNHFVSVGRPLSPYLKNTEVAPDGLLGFSLVSPSFFPKTQGFWKLLLATCFLRTCCFGREAKSCSSVDVGSRAADGAPNTGILPRGLRLCLFLSRRHVLVSSGLTGLCQPLPCLSQSHTRMSSICPRTGLLPWHPCV